MRETGRLELHRCSGEMKWASGSSLLAPLDIWAIILRVRALACASESTRNNKTTCAHPAARYSNLMEANQSREMSCLFVCLRTPDPRPCVSVRVCTRMCVCLGVVETAKVNCFVDSGKRGKMKEWRGRPDRQITCPRALPSLLLPEVVCECVFV